MASAWWVLAVLGLPAMATAWIWFGMAFEEEMSEQCKAVIAGTTMAGFGAVLGVPPLVLAHVIGLIALGIIGYRGRRKPSMGIVSAVVVVVGASVIGLVVADLLYAGRLFTMGVATAGCG